MFEAVTGLSTFTFEHDFVNGSYPNVETDDIVDDAGIKYVYDGADTIGDFDLSSINYSTSSNWTAVNEVTTSTTGRDLAVDYTSRLRMSMQMILSKPMQVMVR